MPTTVSMKFACLCLSGVSCADCVLGPATLSTLMASSLGFLRRTSSVGVSGDRGIAASAVSVMSRSWSATAFRGLSPPDEGTGLPRAGIAIGAAAGRRARAVLSKGMGGGWSRLRLGDGCARCVGISPVSGCQSYMDTAGWPRMSIGVE